MVRSLQDALAALPAHRLAEIDRRFNELVNEVESLRELRRISEISQAKIAETLNISQPAVSKIEKQTDMYLSTLRSYVEAMGGELEVVIRLPSHGPVKVKSLEFAGFAETKPEEVFGSLPYSGPSIEVEQMSLGASKAKRPRSRTRG
jgi:transcriptional regulator with XRE-family HTH domain